MGTVPIFCEREICSNYPTHLEHLCPGINRELVDVSTCSSCFRLTNKPVGVPCTRNHGENRYPYHPDRWCPDMNLTDNTAVYCTCRGSYFNRSRLY